MPADVHYPATRWNPYFREWIEVPVTTQNTVCVIEPQRGLAKLRPAAEHGAHSASPCNQTELTTVLRDIADRRKDKDLLRLAVNVFAHSYEGFLLTDANNLIIDVNPSFTRITGYARDESIGRSPNFLSSGRQSAAFYGQMWTSLLTQGFWQGELWNRRKNGEVFPEFLTIATIRDDCNRVSHHVATLSDISAQKRVESQHSHPFDNHTQGRQPAGSRDSVFTDRNPKSPGGPEPLH